MVYCGFLALYPGIYGYDAGRQIWQIQYDDVKVTSHFSVIYSYILYAFVQLGDIVFSSYTAGFAIYIFLQMCILTYIATKICFFTYKLLKNKKIFIGTMIFYSIFPLYIIMMLSSAQDTIWGGMLALILMNVYEIIDKKSTFLNNPKKIVFFILENLIMCMFRNNGIYILIISFIAMCFLVKKNKKILIAIYSIVLVLFIIYKGPIFKVLNVTDVDSLQEMASIPCQQIARTYIYNKEIYSEEDLNIIDNIFKDRNGDLFEYYTVYQSISDSIKETIDQEYVKSNKVEVLNLYIKGFWKDPQNYIEGFLLNSLGFWYPNKNYPDTRMYHPYIETKMLEAKKWNERYIEIENQSIFPIYYKYLCFLVEKNGIDKIPVISSIFKCGTYFLLLLFTCMYIIYKKQYRKLYIMSYLIGYYITLLLAPVCIFRYCFAFAVSIPILISILIKCSKEDKKLLNSER